MEVPQLRPTSPNKEIKATIEARNFYYRIVLSCALWITFQPLAHFNMCAHFSHSHSVKSLKSYQSLYRAARVSIILQYFSKPTWHNFSHNFPNFTQTYFFLSLRLKNNRKRIRNFVRSGRKVSTPTNRKFVFFHKAKLGVKIIQGMKYHVYPAK